MKPYIEWTKEELVAEKARLEQEFAEVKAKGLNLNISRGKPAAAQLDLTEGMLTVLSKNEDTFAEDGTDCRNYGVLTGIPEARKLIGDICEVPAENGGNDRRAEGGHKCNNHRAYHNKADTDAVKPDQPLFVPAAVVEAEHRCNADAVAEVQRNKEKLSVQNRRDGGNTDFALKFQHQHIEKVSDNGCRKIADHLGGTVEAACGEQAFGKFRPGEAKAFAGKGKV